MKSPLSLCATSFVATIAFSELLRTFYITITIDLIHVDVISKLWSWEWEWARALESKRGSP